MRGALLVMVAFVVLFAAAAWYKGVFTEGLRSSGTNLVRFAPILLVAFLLMGFVDVLLPEGLVESWLTDEAGWRGLFLGWLGGIVTPGGSIIGLPLAAVLYREGVGLAVLVTYLTSIALLSVIRLPLEAGFLGWQLAAVRYGASLVLPFVAGGLVLLLNR